MPALANAGPGLAPPAWNCNLQTFVTFFLLIRRSSYILSYAVVIRTVTHSPTHAYLLYTTIFSDASSFLKKIRENH